MVPAAGAGGHTAIFSPFALPTAEIREWWDGSDPVGRVSAPDLPSAPEGAWGGLSRLCPFAVPGPRPKPNTQPECNRMIGRLSAPRTSRDPPIVLYITRPPRGRPQVRLALDPCQRLDPEARAAHLMGRVNHSPVGDRTQGAWRDIWSAGQGQLRDPERGSALATIVSWPWWQTIGSGATRPHGE